jgi:hypothetical protein
MVGQKCPDRVLADPERQFTSSHASSIRVVRHCLECAVRVAGFIDLDNAIAADPLMDTAEVTLIRPRLLR